MREIESYPFIYHMYNQNNTSKGKTIIIYHGWGSSVKNYDEMAKYLSSLGFQVIIPELIFHDNRNKVENHLIQEVTQRYFWNTIFISMDEAPLLFKELGIQKEDIILMGVSMGGFIANGIFASSPDFAGLININGSGSFLLSEKIFRDNDSRPELKAKEINQLNQYDPINKNKSSSPILLMHGEQDSVVSIEGQRNYFNYLTENEFTHQVVFSMYKEINHSFSEKMNKDLMDWLQKNFINNVKK